MAGLFPPVSNGRVRDPSFVFRVLLFRRIVAGSSGI